MSEKISRVDCAGNIFLFGRRKKNSIDVPEKNLNSHLYCRVHCALVWVQVFYGTASVVTSMGLSSVNPLYFALIREMSATCILTFLSIVLTRFSPWACRPYWRRFLFLGFIMFLNQTSHMIGLKLTDPVTGIEAKEEEILF